MVVAHVKPIAINFAMFVNPFATNAVKTTQIHTWWYEEIARFYSAQRNSDPARAYISVVNELSQQMCSMLALCIRLLHRSLDPVRQCYITARYQSTV